MSPTFSRTFFRIGLCMVALILWSLGTCAGAEKQKIQQAIANAQAFLLKNRFSGGSGAIAALAYVKSGGDKHSPQLEPIIEEILRKAPVDSKYRPIPTITMKPALT